VRRTIFRNVAGQGCSGEDGMLNFLDALGQVLQEVVGHLEIGILATREGKLQNRQLQPELIFV
jgi:hypothetical protein